MKRILFGAVVLAALATAVVAIAQPAKHRVTKRHVNAVTAAAPAGGQWCDPAKCPPGSCSRCAAAGAAAAASQVPSAKVRLASSGSRCAGVDPASCPAGCRTSTAAKQVAAR